MNTTETPYIACWRAINTALAARGELPADAGEVDKYIRANKCDVFAVAAIAWNIARARAAIAAAKGEAP